jgi:hypothetical protein
MMSSMERAVRMTMLSDSRPNEQKMAEETKDEYAKINTQIMKLTSPRHSYIPNRLNDWDDAK